MPDRTDAVLDAIDGALEDRTVSGDAMRWSPEPPTCTHVWVTWAGSTQVWCRYCRDTWERALPPSRPVVLPAPVQPQVQLTPEQAEALVRAAAAAGRLVARVLDEFFRRLSGLSTTTRDEYALVPSQQVDVRRRALEARRNRGTGPGPDRLDGRRSRR